MEQHPVPQQISAYHFRLVGDMTIKQFLELSGGIAVAWVIYSLPITGIIRWPLVIFSVFIGIALAFLPLEERPLDRWFLAFIKAIYSPTEYLWKKSTKIPHFFQVTKPQKQPDTEKVRIDRTKLKKYLETLPAQGPLSKLDQEENRFLTNIMNIYMEVQPTTKSQIKPRYVTLEEERMPKIKIRKLQTPPLDPHSIIQGEVRLPRKIIGKPKQVQIPMARPIDVEKISASMSPSPPAQSQVLPTESLEGISPIWVSKPKTHEETPLAQATTSKDLPFPITPSEPNVLVGMVLDNQGNIISNAIITIRDSEGNVARAQKTNKIGQFFIATPLKNDTYEIETEHEGLSFDIIKIELTGNPVSPIEIRAK